MNATTPAARFEVTCDMSGLTSRAGTALLTGLCDVIGFTDGLVEALSVHSRAVRHEPGRIVRDLSVMLSDGGDCLTDLGVLRACSWRSMASCSGLDSGRPEAAYSPPSGYSRL